MWDTFVVNPMINALLMLYDFLGNNFFLAIAVFTLAIRLVTLPLNMRQQRSSLKAQEMQPQIQAIQKKYKDNPQKMQEEFARIGYNPAESLLGCLPLLLQMPILFGLYQAIRLLLSSTPLSTFELGQRVYSFIDLQNLFPLSNRFLWMNLAQPDPLFVLPIVVFATTWLQQKLLSPRKPEEDKNKKGKGKQEENPMAGMTQSMQVTMPVMFGFMSLSFPAGLSLYFILSNVIGIGQGWLIRRNMPPPGSMAPKVPAKSSADLAVEGEAEIVADEVLAEPATASSNGRAEAKKGKPSTGSGPAKSNTAKSKKKKRR